MHASSVSLDLCPFFLFQVVNNCPNFAQLLEPHPAIVASKLLARKKFVDNGKQFNMIACSWIQFMIHDWVDHLEDTEQV